MESQQQCEREICRLIILGRDRTEVLLTSAESGLALPVVEIPRWERLAENLTGSLRTDWGCDAICLFTPNCSSEDRDSNGKHYVVMECWCDEGQSGETVWKPIGSLTAGSFRQAAEFRVFEQSLQELDIYQRDPSSPFTRKGWLAELRGWTAEVIRPLGLELTGSFCQYNGSPCFSLIRFETNGPAVWFKATGKPNRREFPITLKLAERFPRFIPKILGTKPEWNGWLSGGRSIARIQGKLRTQLPGNRQPLNSHVCRLSRSQNPNPFCGAVHTTYGLNVCSPQLIPFLIALRGLWNNSPRFLQQF